MKAPVVRGETVEVFFFNADPALGLRARRLGLLVSKGENSIIETIESASTEVRPLCSGVGLLQAS